MPFNTLKDFTVVVRPLDSGIERGAGFDDERWREHGAHAPVLDPPLHDFFLFRDGIHATHLGGW